VRMFTKQVLAHPKVQFEDNHAFFEEAGKIKVVFFKEAA